MSTCCDLKTLEFVLRRGAVGTTALPSSSPQLVEKFPTNCKLHFTLMIPDYPAINKVVYCKGRLVKPTIIIVISGAVMKSPFFTGSPYIHITGGHIPHNQPGNQSAGLVRVRAKSAKLHARIIRAAVDGNSIVAVFDGWQNQTASLRGNSCLFIYPVSFRSSRLATARTRNRSPPSTCFVTLNTRCVRICRFSCKTNAFCRSDSVKTLNVARVHSLHIKFVANFTSFDNH